MALIVADRVLRAATATIVAMAAGETLKVDFDPTFGALTLD